MQSYDQKSNVVLQSSEPLSELLLQNCYILPADGNTEVVARLVGQLVKFHESRPPVSNGLILLGAYISNVHRASTHRFRHFYVLPAAIGPGRRFEHISLKNCHAMWGCWNFRSSQKPQRRVPAHNTACTACNQRYCTRGPVTHTNGRRRRRGGEEEEGGGRRGGLVLEVAKENDIDERAVADGTKE